MAKRVAIILVLGMLTLAFTLATANGVRTKAYIHREFSDLGLQNALLGSQITQYAIEKAVDNGLFDLDVMFKSSYHPIAATAPAQYHTDYDYFFDRNIRTILDAFLTESKIYYAYVVNQDGYIPTHSDTSLAKTKTIPPRDHLSAAERQRAHQYVYQDAKGNKYCEFHAPIVVHNRHWGEFRVGIPAALISNRIRDSVAGTFLVTLLFALTIGGLVLRLVIRKLRPLSKMTNATRRMAGGDLTARCDYQGDDEVGVLARAFNTMAEKISQTHDFLEQQIQDRTVQLEAANEGLRAEVLERKRAEEQLLATKSQLEDRNNELERFNRAMVGREERILQLKVQVNDLCSELGRDVPFQVIDDLEQASSKTPPTGSMCPPAQEVLEAQYENRFAGIAPILQSFCNAVGTASAVVDMKGNVLVNAGWQRICTEFHRQHPETCRRCVESDTLLANDLREGRRFSLYTCKNGLTDAASPIMVRGKHVANLFVGQFLLQPPDEIFFRDMARKFGFPVEEYLSALRDVPLIDEDRLKAILQFLCECATLLTVQSLEQTDLAVANANLAGSRHAALSLLEDAERARREMESANLQLQEETARVREMAIKAQRADAAKSEFLANMSHEIRTPMAAILGFADVLVAETNASNSVPDQIEAAKTIKRNGEYLLGLINDILDISKIEAGKLTIEQMACQPCRIVAEVQSLMQVRSEAKGLRFSVEYEGAVPETIQTDPVRLRQILINIVGNAIKFTELGNVRLIIRIADAESETPRLEFDIADTGIGISQENAGKLFQPFTQADNSTTRRFGGTGLGLTISKRLAGLLGGDVFLVESRLGRGSRFRLSVPTGPLWDVRMLDDPATATIILPRQPQASLHDSTIRINCRILLAEDGPDNQRLITHLLKKAGASVHAVENGRLAMEAAMAALSGTRPYDIILMDMQMPEMDGYEATRNLRAQGYTRPIIALTAHAMATDRQKCLDAGCDEYLSKPINRPQLLQVLRRHMVEGSSTDAAATGSVTPLSRRRARACD